MVSNHGKSKKSKILCHCGSRNFMHVIRTMKSKKDFSETFFKSNNGMVVA